MADAADQAPQFISPSNGRTHNTKDGMTSFGGTSHKTLLQNLDDTRRTSTKPLQQVTVVNITFQPAELQDEWRNIMF